MRSLPTLLGVAAVSLATLAEAQERRPHPTGAQPRRAAAVVRMLPSAVAADRAVLGVTLGESGPRGLRVAAVADSGPAARAGVRAGDRLVAVGDVSLRIPEADAADPVLRTAPERRLRRALESISAGDELALRVAGDGGERAVRVRTVRADSLQPAVLARSLAASFLGSGDNAALGLSVQATGTARDTLGAFVVSVVPGSPAERAGIYEGARVVAVNGVELRVDAADAGDAAIAERRAAGLERELRRVTAGDEVTLRVYENGRTRDVRVRTEQASAVYGDRLRSAPFGAVRAAPGTRAYTIPRAGTVPRARPGAEPGVRLFRRDRDGGVIELEGLGAPEALEALELRLDGLRELEALEPEIRARVERALGEARRRSRDAGR